MLLSLCLLFLGVRVGCRVPCLVASGCDLVLVLLCSGALPSVVCAGGVWEGGESGCVVFACVSCCFSCVLAGWHYLLTFVNMPKGSWRQQVVVHGCSSLVESIVWLVSFLRVQRKKKKI